MFNIPTIEFDLPKKLKVLSILEDRGEPEALRLYPELKDFIYFCRGKSLDEIRKDILKQSTYQAER
jgi:hypothetical protein